MSTPVNISGALALPSQGVSLVANAAAGIARVDNAVINDNPASLTAEQIKRVAHIKRTTFYLNPNFNNLSVPSIPITITELKFHLEQGLAATKANVFDYHLMGEAAEDALTGKGFAQIDLCFCITPGRHWKEFQEKRKELTYLYKQVGRLNKQIRELKERLKENHLDVDKKKEYENEISKLKHEVFKLRPPLDRLHAFATRPFVMALSNIIKANLSSANIEIHGDDEQYPIHDWLNDEYLHPERFREIRKGYDVVGYHIDLGSVRLNVIYPTGSDWQNAYFAEGQWFVSLKTNTIGFATADLSQNQVRLARLMHRRMASEDFNNSESPFFDIMYKLTQGYECDPNSEAGGKLLTTALNGFRINHASVDEQTFAVFFENFLNTHFASAIPSAIIRNAHLLQVKDKAQRAKEKALRAQKIATPVEEPTAKDKTRLELITAIERAVACKRDPAQSEEVFKCLQAHFSKKYEKLKAAAEELRALNEKLAGPHDLTLEKEYQKKLREYEQKCKTTKILESKLVRILTQSILQKAMVPQPPLSPPLNPKENVNLAAVQRTLRANTQIKFVPSPVSNEIGKMMMCLNSLLIMSVVKDPNTRAAQCKMIATAWLKQTRPPKLLVRLTTLIRDYPQHTQELLSVASGLFYYAWISKQAGTSAYTFPFAEKEHPMRSQFAWAHAQGTQHLVTLHDPIRLSLQFFGYWKKLENAFSGSPEAANCFSHLAEDLGIRAPELTNDNRHRVTRQILNSFDEDLPAWVISRFFPENLKVIIELCNKLVVENGIPREHLIFLQHKIMQLQLRQNIRENGRLERDAITDLQFATLAWTRLPRLEAAQKAQELIRTINSTKIYLDKIKEEGDEEKIKTVRARLNSVTTAIIEFIRYSTNDLGSDFLHASQQLILHADAGYIFIPKDRNFWAGSLLFAMKSANYSRDHLERFLDAIDQWPYKSKKLISAVDEARSSIISSLIPEAQKFSTLSSQSQNEILAFLHTKINGRLTPLQLEALYPIFKHILGNACAMKNSPVFEKVVNFITRFIPHLTEVQADDPKLLELTKLTLTFKKKALDALPENEIQRLHEIGFYLASSLAKKNSPLAVAKTISNFFLEKILWCLSTSATPKNKNTFCRHIVVHFAKALAALEQDQKEANGIWAELVTAGKDDACYGKSLKNLIRSTMHIASTASAALCGKFLKMSSMQSNLLPTTQFEFALTSLKRLALSKNPGDLDLAFELWLHVSVYEPSAKKTETWLAKVIETIHLYRNLLAVRGQELNGQGEKMSVFIQASLNNGEFHLQQLGMAGIENLLHAIRRLSAVNADATKQITETLRVVLIKTSLATETEANVHVRKLSTAPQPLTPISALEDYLTLNEDLLPEDICKHIKACLELNKEEAYKIAITALQKLARTFGNFNKDPLSIKLGVQCINCIPASCKENSSNDRLLVGLIQTLCTVNFFVSISSDDRLHCTKAILELKKPHIFAYLWRDLTAKLKPQDMYPLCKQIRQNPDPKNLQFLQEYLEHIKYKDLQVYIYLIEAFISIGNPVHGRMAVINIHKSGILLDNRIPADLRMQAFHLSCEFIAAACKNEKAADVLQTFSALHYMAWMQLEAEYVASQRSDELRELAKTIVPVLSLIIARGGSAAAVIQVLNLLSNYASPNAPEILAFLLSCISKLNFTIELEEVALKFGIILKTYPNVFSNKQVEAILQALHPFLALKCSHSFAFVHKVIHTLCTLENADAALKANANQDVLSTLLTLLIPFIYRDGKIEEQKILTGIIEDILDQDHEALVQANIENQLQSLHRSLKTLSLDALDILQQKLDEVIACLPLCVSFKKSIGYGMVQRIFEKTADPNHADQWPMILDFMQKIYQSELFGDDDYSIQQRGEIEFKLLVGLFFCKKQNFCELILIRLNELVRIINIKEIEFSQRLLRLFEKAVIRGLELSSQNTCDNIIAITCTLMNKLNSDNFDMFLKSITKILGRIQILSTVIIKLEKNTNGSFTEEVVNQIKKIAVLKKIQSQLSDNLRALFRKWKVSDPSSVLYFDAKIKAIEKLLTTN